MIYYGDEYGMPGAGDPDNRRFMKWPSAATPLTPFEQATLDLTKKLGAARHELVALERGDRKTLWIDDDHYVFARTTPQKDVAIVVLNRNFNDGVVAGGAGAVVCAAGRRHGAQGSPRRPVGDRHRRDDSRSTQGVHSSAVLAP